MEKETYKPKVEYEMCGDKVSLVIPQGNYNERRLVMTKDLFIACYEHWIKKVEHDRISTEGKTGKWIDPESPECYKCSACGKYTNQEYGLDKPLFYKYCPNCGARMED